MASKNTRKRRRSAPSESEISHGSQDSMSNLFETLDVFSQDDGSASESTIQFKKPRKRREVPSETPAAKKLDYVVDKYTPESYSLDLLIDDRTIVQEVSPIFGNYIVNLDTLVSSLSEVATCIKCKAGVIKLFEMNCPGTCASKLVFRCSHCYNSKLFMSVGEINSGSTNSLDLSTVLGGCLSGLNRDRMSIYHSSLNLPPPLTRSLFTKIQQEVVAAAEEEAKSSMEKAMEELKSTMDIDHITKCAHVIASFDGAYHSSCCFSSAVSTATNKVIAYKVATNSCATCSRYQNKVNANTVLPSDQSKFDVHRKICQAEYSDYADSQLESAIAPELIKQAHERGVVFPTVICDGDNDTVESLNKLHIYQNSGINLNIKKIECLSHVMRNLMNDLTKNQLKAGQVGAGKRLMEEASVKSEPKEIKEMSYAISGRVTHLYRLALKNNYGDPARAKAEIDAIPLHLGANYTNAEIKHQSCPSGEDSWCDYQKHIGGYSSEPEYSDYLSEELTEHVARIFTKYKYNDEEFIQTLGFGMTTNQNEVVNHILFSMVQKKDRGGFNAMKLGAALAIIRYNDGYKAVQNIFDRFSTSNPFIRTKEAFRQLDNDRIINSKDPTPWRDTYSQEQARMAKQKDQMDKYGTGYSHGMYSRSHSVTMDSDDLFIQEDSQDDD